jgi:hypothetical protein
MLGILPKIEDRGWQPSGKRHQTRNPFLWFYRFKPIPTYEVKIDLVSFLEGDLIMTFSIEELIVILLAAFLIPCIFTPAAVQGEEYPWKVSDEHLFSSDKYNTIVGFHMLYAHILTYYPGKHDITIYKQEKFHDRFFEVVMDAVPEMGCGESDKIIVYRALWVGNDGDVLCQWGFYESLDCEEFKKDEEVFVDYFCPTSCHLGDQGGQSAN